MNRIKKFPKAIVLLSLLGFFACSPKFVKEDVIKELEKKYSGVYVVKKDIEVGVNEEIKAGTKVRLYFVSGRKLIKVYAYQVGSNRETALGKNILLLFETDFPDKKFSLEIFEEKLNEIVKKLE